MRRIMQFRVGGRDVHLPKLVGAFILFAALLMFIKGSAEMFESWDSLKQVESCFSKIDVLSPAEVQQAAVQDCRETLYRSTGIYLREGQGSPTNRQFWSALLGPIASVLLWLAVFFIGWLLYRTGELVIPIEEYVRELPELKKEKEK